MSLWPCHSFKGHALLPFLLFHPLLENKVGRREKAKEEADGSPRSTDLLLTCVSGRVWDTLLFFFFLQMVSLDLFLAALHCKVLVP